jgi:hypothetical protein
MIARMPPRVSQVCDDKPKVGDFATVVWRFDCLLRSGYPTEMAVRLAEDATVDLHDAVELLTRGATPEDALRILL